LNCKFIKKANLFFYKGKRKKFFIDGFNDFLSGFCLYLLTRCRKQNRLKKLLRLFSAKNVLIFRS